MFRRVASRVSSRSLCATTRRQQHTVGHGGYRGPIPSSFISARRVDHHHTSAPSSTSSNDVSVEESVEELIQAAKQRSEESRLQQFAQTSASNGAPISDAGPSKASSSSSQPPLSEETVFDETLRPSSSSSSAPTSSHAPQQQGYKRELPTFTCTVMDRHGMKVEPTAEESSLSLVQLSDVLAIVPEALRAPLQAYAKKFHVKQLTAPQQQTIPLVLQGRDVLCIAPTASGKTLSYLIPGLAQLLRGSSGLHRGDPDNASQLNSENINELMKQKIANGEVCRYCELDVRETRVCPMTGHVHPPAPDAESIAAVEADRKKRSSLRAFASGTSPLMLIVVPTTQLAHQVYQIARSLDVGYRCGIVIRHLSHERVGAEQLYFGCDICVATPESLLVLLYKQKISLRKVQVFVMDEVDTLLSTNSFEQIKIILGALPKQELRPQRLLFGATLPPPIHEMIRRDMLMASHRFVLADYAPLRVELGSDDDEPVKTIPTLVTHHVSMVSRTEKVDKLVAMYDAGLLQPSQRTIVFCNSRNNVNYVAQQLTLRLQHHSGVRVCAISGQQSNAAKDSILKMFQSGVCSVLVTTDFTSRGIDFHNVIYVVNYDLPSDFETFVHRCGRCGRHGLRGYAYTLFQPEDVKLAKPLVGYLRERAQLVPAKLREYAKQHFVDLFASSLHHHPTKTYRRTNPEVNAPVMGRGVSRIPDYKQSYLNKNFRPR